MRMASNCIPSSIRPNHIADLLPILFQRTPYGIDGTYRAFPSGILKELIEEVTSLHFRIFVVDSNPKVSL
jgi:hypothetical protein